MSYGNCPGVVWEKNEQKSHRKRPDRRVPGPAHNFWAERSFRAQVRFLYFARMPAEINRDSPRLGKALAVALQERGRSAPWAIIYVYFGQVGV
jgi:hypothetical protein